MKARSSFSALVAPAILAASLLCPALQAQAKPASDLNNVLAQLDTASTHFKSATASFEWDNYERVVRDTTVQNGTIYFERSGSSTQMGAIVSDAGSKEKPKVIEYKSGVLRMYEPSQTQVTLLKAGSNQAQYEGFLTLGFGGSGKDLATTWNITDQGSEMLSDGKKDIKTEKLDLIAKDPGLRNTFTHVTIWVDATRGVSLKQIFFTPSGDTRTSHFTNIKLNGNVDYDAYKIPKNVPTVVH